MTLAPSGGEEMKGPTRRSKFEEAGTFPLIKVLLPKGFQHFLTRNLKRTSKNILSKHVGYSI
jgi:hypothetical protein